MNFASKGLSWAENIYLKLEKICTDSDVVQVPCKYVDAVGEHFRNMLDEVASDWPNPSDGCVDESDSSLEHNVIAEDCEKSRVGIDENALEEKMSLSVEMESIVPSVEDLSLVSSLDVAQDLSYQNKCDEYSLKSISTKATGSQFSDGTGENYKNRHSIISSVGDLSLVTSSSPCSIKSISTAAIGPKFSDDTGEDYKNVDSVVSSVGDLSLVTSIDAAQESSIDAAQELSQQNTCDEYNIKSISSEATGSIFSDGARENYKNAELIVSSVVDLSLVTSFDVAQDLSQQNTCDVYSIKSILIEATGSIFSDGAGENYKNVSNPVAYPADVIRSFASADEVCPSESHQNELMEGGSMLSQFTSSTEIHGTCISQQTVSLLESHENEREQQIETNKFEAPVRLPEIDGCDKECGFNRTDAVHLKTELMELFEDVNLDDGWDDTEKFELDLISHRACKNMSYKKKLGRAFISKVLSAKGHKRAEKLYHGIDMGMQISQRIDASSFSSGDRCPMKSSTQDSCESDWVLL